MRIGEGHCTLRVPVLAQPGSRADESVHHGAPHPAGLALERGRPCAGQVRCAVHAGAAAPGHVRVQPSAGGGALRHRRSDRVQVSAPGMYTTPCMSACLACPHVCETETAPSNSVTKLPGEPALRGACTCPCKAIRRCCAAGIYASSMRTTLSAVCRRCR